MNVGAHPAHIAILGSVHDQRFVTTLKQMTMLVMPDVGPNGKRPLQPLHPRHQISLWRLYQQVIMIIHPHIRMNKPTGALANIGTGFDKSLPILVIFNYRTPMIAPAHHMVTSVNIFNTWFSSCLLYTSPSPRD